MEERDTMLKVQSDAFLMMGLESKISVIESLKRDIFDINQELQHRMKVRNAQAIPDETFIYELTPTNKLFFKRKEGKELIGKERYGRK